MYDELENFLAHYGVKGMKWGVRRDEATLRRLTGQRVKAGGGTREERKTMNKQAKKDWKDYKKSTTRKERKADSRAANESKMQYILDQIINDAGTMIEVRENGVRNLMLGDEFIERLSANGGLVIPMNVEISDYRVDAEAVRKERERRLPA